ncbi:MAG TPA: acyl-CoA desaturase [Polyangiaceae bacterium]|nr:acyl-CoA desaturase [Polyangiaceae bacterium]
MNTSVVIILSFFVLHWQLSVFSQTFFLHRYCAHRMFTMSKGWEKFFYLFTYVTQGSSYLVPRGYAILHRMHHAYSDTPKDPHSPRNYGNVMSMMLDTKHSYDDYAYERVEPEARFKGGYPEWRALDKLGQSWVMRLVWVGAYTLFYVKFATAPWMYALLPFHYVMGPIHGAIVNWGGHKYGYQNFDNHDDSKNTLIFDFLTGGELFQNNHHKFGMSPNFAARWFEFDSTYFVMRILAAVGIIDMTGAQQIRYPAERGAQIA